MPRVALPRITPDRFAAVLRDFQASDQFNNYKQNTKDAWRYIYRLAEHPDTLGSLYITQIDTADIQDFLDGLAEHPYMQHRGKRALRAVEKWALQRRRMPRAIVRDAGLVKADGSREPWTLEEVDLGEQHARPHFARIITLGSMTGQRLGDMIRMQWTHLRTYRGELGIDVLQEKTGLKMWVPIIQEFQPILASWPRVGKYILTRADGFPWVTRKHVSEKWCKERVSNPMLAPIAARMLTLHGLRATACLRLRADGLSNAFIAACVGMSEKMVDTYCKRENRADTAIEAMQMRERNRPADVVQLPTKRNGNLIQSTAGSKPLKR
jgi:integrase